LFNQSVPMNLEILHEAGHPEPWIIAMNDLPNRATMRDYASRWGIEPMFSDFKRRDFQLEDTQLRTADRLDRLLLIMALAMHCRGRVADSALAARHHRLVGLDRRGADRHRPKRLMGWCPAYTLLGIKTCPTSTSPSA
ncbi:MAG: transposase, partial [Candidatus Contendobacter sp.]|nr:transposase [Candidatus Contendobacter sp.]